VQEGELQQQDLIAAGRRVIEHEAQALSELAARLGPGFSEAVEALASMGGGRAIFSGIGKSGHVAQKIAASLSSIGVAAHFLHPAESMHGDLGVVRPGDMLVAVSYSGETSELADLIAPVRSLGGRIIALTSSPDSTLGRMSDICVAMGRASEADPYNLVPTTSTTLTLALGDALTVALMQRLGVREHDFAVFTLGGAMVVDDDGRLCGLITDGDVRRYWGRCAQGNASVADAMAVPASSVMTVAPERTRDTTLAWDALALMERHEPRPIFVLPVVDADGRPVGLLHLHALVQAGFATSQDSGGG
jgi:arabinose-5-phosphate isomerase